MPDLPPEGWLPVQIPVSVCEELVRLCDRDQRLQQNCLLQPQLLVLNWELSQPNLRAVRQVLACVKPHLWPDAYVLGVQDVRVPSGCASFRGFHRDVRRGGISLTVAINLSGGPLCTEILEGTRFARPESEAYTFAQEQNLAMNRPSVFQPHPPVPLVCVRSSAILFDPATLHRGTPEAARNSHRLFIQLARGPGSYASVARRHKLPCPWNVPVFESVNPGLVTEREGP